MKLHCCHKCWEDSKPSEPLYQMILCKVCGNKRCPKATDHENECTNSNEPGQEGSVYK